jgi:selenide,water dikinase
MTRLNDDAARIARAVGSRCATDVTGFGLLGHLHKMALASGVLAVVDVDAVPSLPGVPDLIRAAMTPGGTARNLDWVSPWLDAGGASAATLHLLADPQTSGGLLIACPRDRAAAALDSARGAGLDAAIVGELVDAATPTSAGPASTVALR